MSRIVSRIVRWMSSSAWVVTSPMTTQSPLVIAVSQATRASRSWDSMPSSTASETWSQTLSGWPSVTDSEVSRKDLELLKDVDTGCQSYRAGMDRPVRRSGPSSLAPILGRLTQQLRLKREDVVEDTVDAPALEPVVRDHASALEVLAQGGSQGPVDAGAAANLGLLEQL